MKIQQLVPFWQGQLFKELPWQLAFWQLVLQKILRHCLIQQLVLFWQGQLFKELP